MSNAGNKLVLAFGHHINADGVTLLRDKKRTGNTLNQIGQVLDELIAEAVKAERDACLKICEEIAGENNPFGHNEADGAEACARAIRGRA